MAPKKATCLKCDKEVSKNAEALYCFCCSLWTHRSCANVTPEQYNVIREMEAQGQTLWSCAACKSSNIIFKQQISELSNKINRAETKIAEHDTEIASLKESTAARLEKVEASVTDLQNTQSNAPSVDIVFEEIRKRESVKNNLVFHQVPEPKTAPPESRREEDRTAVSKIVESLGVEFNANTDIKFMRRAGKYKSTATRPRPLIMGLKNSTLKDRILNNSSKLADHDSYSSVSIVPDLTKRQRDEEQQLREEADKLNKEMNPDESLNWTWKVLGLKGQKKLVKVKITEDQTGAQGGRRKRTREEVNLTELSPGSRPPPARRTNN